MTHRANEAVINNSFPFIPSLPTDLSGNFFAHFLKHIFRQRIEVFSISLVKHCQWLKLNLLDQISPRTSHHTSTIKLQWGKDTLPQRGVLYRWLFYHHISRFRVYSHTCFHIYTVKSFKPLWTAYWYHHPPSCWYNAMSWNRFNSNCQTWLVIFS